MNNDTKPADDKPNLLDSVTVKPRRSYQCEPCGRMYVRKQVGKSATGKFFCPECGTEVTDKTNDQTGKDFLGLMGKL